MPRAVITASVTAMPSNAPLSTLAMDSRCIASDVSWSAGPVPSIRPVAPGPPGP